METHAEVELLDATDENISNALDYLEETIRLEFDHIKGIDAFSIAEVCGLMMLVELRRQNIKKENGDNY